MTATDPDDDATARSAGEPPVFEFHAHAVKLRLLSGLVAVLAAFLLWHAVSTPGAGGGTLPIVGLLILGSILAGRHASDPRPVLTVDAEGLEDRVHGRIPWRDVAFYRAPGGLAPGFGWGLRKGALPPRNATIYTIQKWFNSVSGLPPRSYRRKLMLATPADMAAACRMHRPELEK